MPHTKPQVSKYNASYYRKKKAALRERGEMMKQQFEEGSITAEEYKKFLVGHERSVFTRTMDIEAAVKRRMQELKANDEGGRTGIQSNADAQRLSETLG
jgi:polyhydroxyalkanoate synthesis regulator phasin